jgi:hypothetical protein
VEEPGHRPVADEEVVRVELHMQLCTSQDSARHVERKAMSYEGQDIQAVIPLININEKTRVPSIKIVAYQKVGYL